MCLCGVFRVLINSLVVVGLLLLFGLLFCVCCWCCCLFVSLGASFVFWCWFYFVLLTSSITTGLDGLTVEHGTSDMYTKSRTTESSGLPVVPTKSGHHACLARSTDESTHGFRAKLSK